MSTYIFVNVKAVLLFYCVKNDQNKCFFEIIKSNVLNYNNNKNVTSYQQPLFFHKLLHKSSQLTFRGSAQSYNPLLSPHYVLFLPPPPPLHE